MSNPNPNPNPTPANPPPVDRRTDPAAWLAWRQEWAGNGCASLALGLAHLAGSLPSLTYTHDALVYRHLVSIETLVRQLREFYVNELVITAQTVIQDKAVDDVVEASGKELSAEIEAFLRGEMP